ncbi:tectonin beta-propeller repeat-containing protein 2 [Biomphalaria pfeifferi]|uniref:Tectonin beta-propeller repeat-containing protein 2 n=1 Tax=Biomphalaria pfeifferi TaxID=112525 RepID=A0AAD8F0V0_BIOPF|nr:tectonin beta-propeller repeat-containing protein 2 [Biomphalaria pfeifferi]
MSESRDTTRTQHEAEESPTESAAQDLLREHEKLDSLLCLIPRKAQHGILMSCDLILTCIDANSHFIALGSNVGIIFLFDRKHHTIQKFKSANTSDVITSVRLHHGIDDLIATGTASGDVTVFCMPGITSIQKKQLQKFDVLGLHRHYVTCLEWSTNGMKLYSGDKNGQVVTTEIDFYKGQCSSSILLIEANTEIIQLDYRHRALLVSTRHRSFIIRLDLKSEIVNIGSKDRKIPGPFGACFIPGLCKTDDAKLYAARPGCRLWLADMKGVVSNTIIFSDPMSSSIPEIPLLSVGRLQMAGPSEFQFGNLKWLGNNQIVTWSSSALVVLDPEANRVVAKQGRLSGIVDAAVVEETGEIFLLRRHAEARVIRIASKPEAKPYKEVLMSTLLATHDEKPWTNLKEEDKSVKEADDSINSTLSFFKKLTIPLKKNDKPLISDSLANPTANIPSAILTSNKEKSPDLPPIVKIASPELEGVKLYTGTDSSVTTNTSIVSPTIAEAHPATVLNAYHETHLPSMQYLDPDESIVFKHKVKKTKRKKHKTGSREGKEKDEDSVSQASQISDDLSVTVTPNNTPAVDSPLDTLKKADDFLKHMASILQDDSLNRQQTWESADPTTAEDVITSIVNANEIAHNLNFEETLHNFAEPQTNLAQNIHESVLTPEACLLVETEQAKSQSDSLHCAVNTTEVEPLYSNNTVNVIESVSAYSDVPRSSTKISTSYKLENSVTQADSAVESNTINRMPAEPVCSRSDIDIIDTALANIEMAKSAMITQAVTRSNLEDSQSTEGQIKNKQLSGSNDEFSEVKAIEATDPFRKNYKRNSMTDDFYSHFLDTSPESPESPVSKTPRSPTSAPVILPPLDKNRLEMGDIAKRSLANTWSEFTTPANIYSLVVSYTHVWFTDKSENIYYSSMGSPKGVVWRKATGKANQISVSPSGHIVWRLHHGVVHAGTKINLRHPEGLKWVEAIKDVETMCVDDKTAWYVKKTGEVMMQKGLSHDRPCYKSVEVKCPYRLKHIVCRQGIVWAITEGLKLVVRTGISNHCPEGQDWMLDNRDLPPYLFSHVAIDHERIGWAIDLVGQIWFCDGVSQENPLGSGFWWQLPLSEYILQDETTLDMIKAVAKKFDPTKLSYLLNTNRGGLITAGTQGVWLALDFRNVLQVCRGSVQGYLWLLAQPFQISPSVPWKHICANISHLDWGLVWAQLTKTSEIYTFKQACSKATMIPETSSHEEFSCISVSPVAAWALTDKGAVKVRAGMGPHCPQGSSWVDLDITQLGDAKFVHLSCNSLYVWAVEAEGVIYQRIGARAPDENNLNPVWLPIETFGDIVFTRVHVGPLDWMVWAIDNRRLIYVRAGIKEDMPIGLEWIHVPGIQAIDLALTNSGVWALTSNGEIFFRFGISKERPYGDYWKKIPGIFIKISVSATDELWGINRECQLMQCSLRSLTRQHETGEVPVTRLHSTDSCSEDIDWEIV